MFVLLLTLSACTLRAWNWVWTINWGFLDDGTSVSLCVSTKLHVKGLSQWAATCRLSYSHRCMLISVPVSLSCRGNGLNCFFFVVVFLHSLHAEWASFVCRIVRSVYCLCDSVRTRWKFHTPLWGLTNAFNCFVTFFFVFCSEKVCDLVPLF